MGNDTSEAPAPANRGSRYLRTVTTRQRMTRVLCVVAVFLLAAWWTLALVRAFQIDADPKDVAPYLYAPLCIVIGGWLGWRAQRSLTPDLIARLALAGSAFVALSALLTDHHGRGTTGYANANAALAVQLMAMAGLMAVGPFSRRVGSLGVMVGTAALVLSASRGGIAVGLLLLGIVVLALVARREGGRWVAPLLAVVTYGVASGVLVFLARRPAWPDWLTNALTSTRHDMWRAAWGAFRQAEFFGHGPGGFAWVNPWAFEPETVSAHSVTAQVAAELGGAGLVLLALTFLCGVLWVTATATSRRTWVALASWTALAAHAQMDHVLEYWPVPLAAGLVLGLALQAKAQAKADQEVV